MSHALAGMGLAFHPGPCTSLCLAALQGEACDRNRAPAVHCASCRGWPPAPGGFHSRCACASTVLSLAVTFYTAPYVSSFDLGTRSSGRGYGSSGDLCVTMGTEVEMGGPVAWLFILLGMLGTEAGVGNWVNGEGDTETSKQMANCCCGQK